MRGKPLKARATICAGFLLFQAKFEPCHQPSTECVAGRAAVRERRDVTALPTKMKLCGFSGKKLTTVADRRPVADMAGAGESTEKDFFGHIRFALNASAIIWCVRQLSLTTSFRIVVITNCSGRRPTIKAFA